MLETWFLSTASLEKNTMKVSLCVSFLLVCISLFLSSVSKHTCLLLYHIVASLFFCEADVAIRQLFHFRETGETDSSTFSSAALFLFFIPYITLASLVYGIAVPSGLFVPSLLAGAAFGRLFGHLLHKLDHTSGTFADSGTYALMGAAAVLEGMARMTISLTVILHML